MKQLKNTLYILTPETYLSLQNEAIAVKVGGTEKVRVPASTIDSVFCFGNITVSSPLIAFCGQMKKRIPCGCTAWAATGVPKSNLLAVACAMNRTM